MTDFGRILHAVFSLKKIDIDFWLEKIPRNPNMTELSLNHNLPKHLLTEIVSDVSELIDCRNFKRYIRILDVSYSSHRRLTCFKKSVPCHKNKKAIYGSVSTMYSEFIYTLDQLVNNNNAVPLKSARLRFHRGVTDLSQFKLFDMMDKLKISGYRLQSELVGKLTNCFGWYSMSLLLDELLSFYDDKVDLLVISEDLHGSAFYIESDVCVNQVLDWVEEVSGVRSYPIPKKYDFMMRIENQVSSLNRESLKSQNSKSEKPGMKEVHNTGLFKTRSMVHDNDLLSFYVIFYTFFLCIIWIFIKTLRLRCNKKLFKI